MKSHYLLRNFLARNGSQWLPRIIRPLRMKKFLAFALPLFCTASVFAADVAYTKPVGGMTVAVPSGQTRAVSLPLLGSVVGNGAVIGSITGIGSNYIDVSNAGWTSGAFSNAANPYLLRITSGAAAGRVMPVSATSNTATRLNLTNDGMAIDQVVSPAVGDRYELVLADTLATFFGATTLQGGPDAQSADLVQIWSNTSWVSYYYNTTRSRWERSTDTAASASRDNTLLRQDRGFLIVRRASTPLTMYVTGRVPDVATKHGHLAPGVTLFSHGLPAPTTLSGLALNTQIPGWRGASSSSTALAGADLVQIWGNTAWVSYYFDTTKGSWQRTTDTSNSASRDAIQLAPGQAFLIRRLDAPSSPAQNFITATLPYSI